MIIKKLFIFERIINILLIVVHLISPYQTEEGQSNQQRPVITQFHWKFWTTNFCFWLVNILLPKFDTSSKKGMKMIKTQILWWNTKARKVAFFILN